MRVHRGNEAKQLDSVRAAQLLEFPLILFKLSVATQGLIPLAIKDEMVWSKQQVGKFLHRIAKGALEEGRVTADDTMGSLQNQLHRSQLITCPLLPDMRPFRKPGRLITHGKR